MAAVVVLAQPKQVLRAIGLKALAAMATRGAGQRDRGKGSLALVAGQKAKPHAATTATRVAAGRQRAVVAALIAQIEGPCKLRAKAAPSAAGANYSKTGLDKPVFLCLFRDLGRKICLSSY